MTTLSFDPVFNDYPDINCTRCT